MSKYSKKKCDVYLTAEDINRMEDDEIIGVNQSTIFSKLALLSAVGKDKEAISILTRVSNEILEREKRCKLTLWGAKMSVKDVKRAFGDMKNLRKTSFKKII